VFLLTEEEEEAEMTEEGAETPEEAEIMPLDSTE